ncbi:hypothetical protein [Leptolyngbya sp. 'hensonii']|uniref:hypothetical protein n=1 Tax=Leptolyngbya sp. 'hensonii' TaxID=1922337 RepID=UPI000A4224DA|nr:hypothetical protein [Leptolyngbya sp. 'hensonii']
MRYSTYSRLRAEQASAKVAVYAEVAPSPEQHLRKQQVTIGLLAIGLSAWIASLVG